MKGLARAAAVAVTCWGASVCARNIYTQIEIDAPPERVWQVLARNDLYGDWNPYHVQVSGRLEVGSVLSVQIHKPNGNRIHIKPKVLRVVPHQELTWGGGIRGLFVGEHVFLLKRLKNGRTLLVQKERFAGIFVPLAELDTIEEGYRRMNRALKKRAER